jgi:hypothetical protein
MKLIEPSISGSVSSGQPAPIGHPSEDGKPVLPINDATARMLAQKVVAIIEESDVFQFLKHKMGESISRGQHNSHLWAERLGPDEGLPDPFEDDSLLGQGEEPDAQRLSQAMRGRSPAGGSIVRGSFYPGGKYLPSRNLR